MCLFFVYNLSWWVGEESGAEKTERWLGFLSRYSCIWYVMCRGAVWGLTGWDLWGNTGTMVTSVCVCLCPSQKRGGGRSTPRAPFSQSWLVNEAFLSRCLGYLPRGWQCCPIPSSDTHCSQPLLPPPVLTYSEAVCVAMAFTWAQILKSTKNKHFLPLYSM